MTARVQLGYFSTFSLENRNKVEMENYATNRLAF